MYPPTKCSRIVIVMQDILCLHFTLSVIFVQFIILLMTSTSELENSRLSIAYICISVTMIRNRQCPGETSTRAYMYVTLLSCVARNCFDVCVCVFQPMSVGRLVAV